MIRGNPMPFERRLNNPDEEGFVVDILNAEGRT